MTTFERLVLRLLYSILWRILWQIKPSDQIVRERNVLSDTEDFLNQDLRDNAIKPKEK